MAAMTQGQIPLESEVSHNLIGSKKLSETNGPFETMFEQVGGPSAKEIVEF